jgi:hypothetical protein
MCVGPFSVSIIKCPRLGTLKRKEVYLVQFWRLKVTGLSSPIGLASGKDLVVGDMLKRWHSKSE